MLDEMFNVGDSVIYEEDGILYQIEKVLGEDVYFIGNKDGWCDMVPGHLLTKKKNMRDFLKRGLKGESLKDVLWFYLAILIPLTVIDLVIALLANKEFALQCCPYLAIGTMGLIYIYAYWPEIKYLDDQLDKYANKYPGVFMGLLMGFISFFGIAFGIWTHIWNITIIFSIMSFVGFVFAFLSRNNPRE